MIHRERLSILYLDDEAPCLDIFRQMFGRDHDVRTALTVGEARRALADLSFDIVLSDYRMPETNGSVFLQEVASAQPDCFRVMLTGAAGVGGFIGELGAGVIQLFLKKPWSEEGMRMALELAGAARALPLRPPGVARGHYPNRISRPEGA
ncbi:MAG TPA: response regulator [Pyrinomonadaceae bacterium]|jgi:DNA-binding NtrC family response regulator